MKEIIIIIIMINNNNNNNNNDNNNNNNNNNLYLKRVTQSNGKDLSWGPLACLQGKGGGKKDE